METRVVNGLNARRGSVSVPSLPCSGHHISCHMKLESYRGKRGPIRVSAKSPAQLHHTPHGLKSCVVCRRHYSEQRNVVLSCCWELFSAFEARAPLWRSQQPRPGMEIPGPPSDCRGLKIAAGDIVKLLLPFAAQETGRNYGPWVWSPALPLVIGSLPLRLHEGPRLPCSQRGTVAVLCPVS